MHAGTAAGLLCPKSQTLAAAGHTRVAQVLAPPEQGVAGAYRGRHSRARAFAPAQRICRQARLIEVAQVQGQGGRAALPGSNQLAACVERPLCAAQRAVTASLVHLHTVVAWQPARAPPQRSPDPVPRQLRSITRLLPALLRGPSAHQSELLAQRWCSKCSDTVKQPASSSTAALPGCGCGRGPLRRAQSSFVVS